VANHSSTSDSGARRIAGMSVIKRVSASHVASAGRGLAKGITLRSEGAGRASAVRDIYTTNGVE